MSSVESKPERSQGTPPPRRRPPTGWAVLGALTLSTIVALGAYWYFREHRPARGAEPEGGPALRLDLNSAEARELELLPGVGASRAMRIVKARERRGGFRKLAELDERGVLGPGASQRLAPYLLPLPGDADAGGASRGPSAAERR
jgi:hypothetical protein